MYHECFGGFLERLYGLALPAKGVAADRKEVQTDFTYLNMRQWRKLHWVTVTETYNAGEWEFQEQKVG